MMVLRLNSFLILCACVLLAGCGGGPRDLSEEALDKMAGPDGRKETVPVSGTVFINGEPASKVTIFAYTAESGMEAAQECRTNPDGTYCWTKYKVCDGMVPGEYRLAFAHIPKEGKTKEEGEDMFRGKYRNPIENDFPLVVKSGEPQTELDYQLEN